MNLTEAKEGEEYIIKEILTDDEELTSFLFSLGCPVPDTFIPAGKCIVHGRLSTVGISCKSNPHNSPPFRRL